MKPSAHRQIAILGSTGSIGTQALEVIRALPNQLQVSVLTAGNNAELLIKQAREFVPNAVVIANENKYGLVRDALEKLPIKVFAGEKALEEVVTLEEIDMVLAALVGFAGLKPTLKAIEHGKHIALANKETLVVAGELITEAVSRNRVAMLPVDSEHSAIFQCMVGERFEELEKIYLTASGGPFRGYSLEQLAKVSPAEALRHPNWDMGAKVTIDSASMMNKGLEVIEAKWLFGLADDQIDVVVHPQSIVHSMVQFKDGSMKAQLGLPDMRLPIQYALTYPKRSKTAFPRWDLSTISSLSFEQADTEVFQNLALARKAMKKGGNMPCILNASNEIAVRFFLEGKISFTEMARYNAEAMDKMPFIASPKLVELLETDNETRRWMQSQIMKKV